MNELAWRHHFTIKSLWGIFLDASVVRTGRNSNSSEILCMSSLSASIKRTGSKTTEKRWRHRFPHYKSMGAFCRNGNQNLMQPSPTPVMLHKKFDRDRPTGFRDIQVRVWTTTDGRTTDHWYSISSPCEPSAQVELKTARQSRTCCKRSRPLPYHMPK